MTSKLLKGGVLAATVLTLWLTASEAQAQRRGGGSRGTSVQIGPSGVYVGPSYGGRYYNGRSYDGWNSRYYSDRPYRSNYWDPYPRSYYYPRTYYYDQQYVTPSTTYESFYPSTTTQAAETARIRVRLPDANAEVWFNGALTQQRGMDRIFESPPLSSGARHSYDIRARWTDANGQTMDRTHTIEVEAGRESLVDFTRGPA